jgi:hypothetical protein
MGRKISVDSATMMNKALEVIEAQFLFDLARADRGRDPSAEHHPLDGGVPRPVGAAPARHADMRVPIAYGWRPERIDSGAEPLDGDTVAALTSRRPTTLLPGLGLAWDSCAARRARARCSMPPTRWRWRRFLPEPSASTDSQVNADDRRRDPEAGAADSLERCSPRAERRGGARRLTAS